MLTEDPDVWPEYANPDPLADEEEEELETVVVVSSTSTVPVPVSTVEASMSIWASARTCCIAC